MNKGEVIREVADSAGHKAILLDPNEVKEQQEREQDMQAAMMEAQIGSEQAQAAKTGAEALNAVNT